MLEDVTANRDSKFAMITEKVSGLLSGSSVSAILARGAAGAFIVDGLGQAAVLGVQILLTRTMGKEVYGMYAYAMAWVNVLFLIARLGLDPLLVRHTAAYKANEEWGLLRGLIRRSNLWAFSASLLLAGIAGLVVWLLQDRLDRDLTITFIFGLAVLPLLTAASLCQSTLNGLKHVVLAQLPNRILRQSLLALIILGAIFLFGQQITGPLAMAATFFAVLISFSVGLFWLRGRLPRGVFKASSLTLDREWFTTAMPMLLAGGAYMLTQKTDTLMLGPLAGLEEVGIYAVASRVAEFTLFGLTAATAIAAPMISEAFAQKRSQELQRVVTLTAQGALAFSIPFTIVIFLFGSQILGLFGEEYSEGYWVLAILVGGQFINAMTGPIGVLMNMTGRQKQLLIIQSSALVVNVILNYFLILGYGAIGAAIATGIVNIGWNVVATVYAYRSFNVNSFALAGLWQGRGSK